MRFRHWTSLAVGYFVLSAVLLVWPMYPLLGNRIEPRLWGMPWSLLYVLLVIAANCLVLGVLYVARIVDAREHRDHEPAERKDGNG